ncbi:uncharacterized protein LOC127848014 [Dreissena polymorpha]|uniref:uncharacterized protein LOC127848014 n=1 Tax=Dreissena polymorpha TaxID=45954 RepID=UPI0022645760|nr:uncharacterized protein LOC127848014 [Dreissena polymorpha]
MTLSFFCNKRQCEAARITISDVSWLNRQKREAGRFPDKARIRISFDSRLIDFDIQRTYPAGFAPRVFVKREGAIVQNPYQMLQAGIYQDVSHGGAFLLCHRSANRSIESPDESRDAFEIFGSFHADNDQFVVQPSPDNVKGHMVSKIANEKLFFDSTKPQDYTYKAGLLESAARQHLRFRRQTKKYEIELLSVVDYNSYLFWYNLTAGSSDRHTDTVANIMEYMTYMVSAIDVRYQSISGEPFTISVLNSGVFIADTPEASPWSVTKVTDGRLPSNEGLTAFTEWVKSQTGLPKHDHAMGFTGYDVIGMTSGSDSSGIAGLRVLCTKDSTSLVEDKFNFITMTTASHELGHSLGAFHDGTGNTCSSSDHYIMASSNNIVLDPVMAGHPWRFSRCSVEAFVDYIGSMDRTGTNCMLSTAFHSQAATTNRPMAQAYAPDATCVNRFGSGSFVCRSLQDYSALCRSMFCNQPNTTQCFAVIPAEGTTCGQGKWCDQGVCVTSSRAPTDVTDNCPIGDRPGLFETTGMTCAEYIASNPGNCYNNYTRTSCCESCNKKEKPNPDCRYGDRGTFCSGIQRYSCYSNENYCCESCLKLKNSSLSGCEYGDKLTGCDKTYCPFYSDQDRVGCCETCYDPSRPTSPATTTVVTTATSTTLKPTPAPTPSTKATTPPPSTPPTTTTPSSTPPPPTTSSSTQPPTITSSSTLPPTTNTTTATTASSTSTHFASTPHHTIEKVTPVMTSEVTPESMTSTTETKTISPNKIEQDIVPVAIPIGIGTAVGIAIIITVCCVCRRLRHIHKIHKQQKLAVNDGSYDNIGFTRRQPSTQETSVDRFRPTSNASHGSTFANGSLLYADGYMMPAPSVISEMSVQYTAPNKAGFLSTLKNAKLIRNSQSPGSIQPPLPDVSKRVSRPVHYKRATGSLTGTLSNQSRSGSVEANVPEPGFSGEMKRRDSDTYDSIGDVLNNIPKDRRPTLPENHPRNMNEMIKQFEHIQSSEAKSKSLSHIQHNSPRVGTYSLPPLLSGSSQNEYNMPASPTSTTAPTPSPRHKTAASHSLPPPPTQYDNNAYCNDPEYDDADPPPRRGTVHFVDSHASGEYPDGLFNDSYLISQQLERPTTRTATTEKSAEQNGMPSIGKNDLKGVHLPPKRPVPRRQLSSELPGNTVNGLPLKQTLKTTSDNFGHDSADNVTDRQSSEGRGEIMPPLPPNKPVPRRQSSRGKSNTSSPLSGKENTDIASKLPPNKPVPRRVSGELSIIASPSSDVLPPDTSNTLQSTPIRPVLRRQRRQSSPDNSTVAPSAQDQKATETFGKSALVPPSRPTPRRQSSSESSGIAATAPIITSTQPVVMPDGPLKALPKLPMRPPIKPVPILHSPSENSNDTESLSTQVSNQTPQSQTIVQAPSSRSDGDCVKSHLVKIPPRPPNDGVPRGQTLGETSNQTQDATSGTTNPYPKSSSVLQSSATEGCRPESNTAPNPQRRPLPRRQSSNAPKAIKISKPDVFEI